MSSPTMRLLAEAGLTPETSRMSRSGHQIAADQSADQGAGPGQDADISAYYAQHKADQFTKPDRAHIKRIVLQQPGRRRAHCRPDAEGPALRQLRLPRSLARQFPGGDVPVWVNLDAPASLAVRSCAHDHRSRRPSRAVRPASSGRRLPAALLDRPGRGERSPSEVVPLDQVKDSDPLHADGAARRQDPTAAQTVTQQLRDYQAKAKITIPDKRYAQLLTQLTAPPPPAAAARRRPAPVRPRLPPAPRRLTPCRPR